ncbi:redoxin domain-containing protein [Zhouia sp. PK063]|uniref:redoxin domain-containing protein n=1 Tax=Zhouia sp. PK063 TaxID=3373602 RepID=UPI0037B18BE3
MRKVGLFLCAAIAMTACNSVKENQFKITGHAEGVDDGQKVVLQKIEQNAPMPIDTVEVKKGAFTFTGEATTPAYAVVTFDGVRGGIPVILEEGNISIEAYKDSLNLSDVSGTKSNNDFKDLIGGTKELRGKMTSLREQMMKASQAKDTATMKTLQETFMEIQEEGKNNEVDFVKNHPDSYISLLVLEQMSMQQPDKANELFQGLSDEVKAYPKGQELAKRFEALNKVAIGAMAPEFSGPTPEGDTLSLASVKGKVTVIDFWASWCKPCRAENPHVVEIYKELHDKGLNIVGVSLDRKAEDWKKAIEDDQLPWKQVSNLKFWQDPIAQEYNVRAIPATFILDASGKIVAKDLRGDDLKAKIEELLAK